MVHLQSVHVTEHGVELQQYYTIILQGGVMVCEVQILHLWTAFLKDTLVLQIDLI